MKRFLAIILVALFSVPAAAQSANDLVQTYLSQNKITWAPGDWTTCEPQGGQDGICKWDASKLGTQPTSAQLQGYVTIWQNVQQAKQFDQLLAQGVAISCVSGATTCTSAIVGTYSLNTDARSNMQAERLSVLANNAFINGTTNRQWLDTSNAAHTFTTAQFVNMVMAAGKYYDSLVMTRSMLAAGQAASWPSSTVAIQ